MSIAVKKNRPVSQKHVIAEISIGTEQMVWFNYSAGTYYVDFDAVYALIDPSYLAGVTAQSIVNVGGVSSDAAPLLEVGSVSTVESTELSFYFDSTDRALYVHIQDGDRPSMHKLVIGVVFGVANHAGVWGSTFYEPRLKSAPNLTKTKDPLFFGKISIDTWSITVDNMPGPGEETGPFDSLLDDYDVYGNRVEILIGYDNDDRTDFAVVATGFIGSVTVGAEEMVLEAYDLRESLKDKIPDKYFDSTTYPDLGERSEGECIPIGYGVIKNAPCTCTNEGEAGAPATYAFKICDMSRHAAISAITTIYVDGVVKVPTATDLAAATFTLATADYDPGQDVTVDYSGYKDSSGNLIENALDVMKDLIVTWSGTPYLPETFSIGEWATARIGAPDIGLFVDDETEILEILENICMSARVNLDITDDGRYTARRYNALAAYKYEFFLDELLEIPKVTADPSEVLAHIRVGYDRDCAKDEYVYLVDDSIEDEVFDRYKRRPRKTFDTVLTNATDAQAFATDMLSIAAYVNRKFTLRTKTQAQGVEVGDFIKCPIRRRSGKGLLGDVIAEVIGTPKNFDAREISLECRIIEILPDLYYVQGSVWGDYVWGDYVWEITHEEIAS